MPKTKYQFSANYELIIDLLSDFSLDYSKYNSQHINWNYINEFSKNHGLSGLIYRNIQNNYKSKWIPNEFLSKIKSEYLRTCIRNSNLNFHYKKLLNFLNQNNIPVIPLKGIFLTEFVYQDFGLRPMCDIDLLIKEKYIKRVKEHLEKNKYNSHAFKRSKFFNENVLNHHLPALTKGIICFELHYQLCYYTKLYSVNINELWHTSVNISNGNNNINIIDTEHLLIYHCFHIHKHMEAGLVRLGQVYDILQIVIRYKYQIDWDRLNYLCNKYNLSGIVQHVFHICKTHFNLNIPAVKHEITNIRHQEITNQNFSNILKGKKVIPAGLKNIRRKLEILTGIKVKAAYLYLLLFPNAEYMKNRYNLENNFMLLFFYPYRILNRFFKLLSANYFQYGYKKYNSL